MIGEINRISLPAGELILGGEEGLGELVHAGWIISLADRVAQADAEAPVVLEVSHAEPDARGEGMIASALGEPQHLDEGGGEAGVGGHRFVLRGLGGLR